MKKRITVASAVVAAAAAVTSALLARRARFFAPPAEETPRASYELDPALIQLVGVLCLIGGCLGLVVYAILSIDE